MSVIFSRYHANSFVGPVRELLGVSPSPRPMDLILEAGLAGEVAGGAGARDGDGDGVRLALQMAVSLSPRGFR